MSTSTLRGKTTAERVHQFVADARSAWPAAHVDDASVRDLTFALPEDASDESVRSRVQDLFLCRLCETGDTRAIALLERAHLARLDRELARTLGAETLTR